jgi:hypothetical protein
MCQRFFLASLLLSHHSPLSVTFYHTCYCDDNHINRLSKVSDQKVRNVSGTTSQVYLQAKYHNTYNEPSHLKYQNQPKQNCKNHVVTDPVHVDFEKILFQLPNHEMLMPDNKDYDKQDRKHKRNERSDSIDQKPVSISDTNVFIVFIQTARVVLTKEYKVINPSNESPNNNSFEDILQVIHVAFDGNC